MAVLNDYYVDVLRGCLDCFWTVYGRFMAYLWSVLWDDFVSVYGMFKTLF